MTTTLLVDTDAVLNLDPWSQLAAERRWLHFYLHITDAQPRSAALLDVIQLAESDGLRVRYSSRWPEMTAYLLKGWLDEHGYPAGYVHFRHSSSQDPVTLAALHARAAARGGELVMVHHDADIAAELRAKHSLAALGDQQLPATVEGLRRVFSLARPAPFVELPSRGKLKSPNTSAA